MAIVLGSAVIGSQLSTSGGLGEVRSGIVEDDDASHDESAATPSSDEAESYIVIGDEGATDETSAQEGTVIFVDEDSELGRALAEVSKDGDQADKDSSDDEGGFPIIRPKP
jgi:hypothetical protein